MNDDVESGKKSGRQQERPPGREMARRMGEHRHNLVLPPLGSLSRLTLAGTVQLGHFIPLNICICVKFFTISPVLFVQCVPITPGVGLWLPP